MALKTINRVEVTAKKDDAKDFKFVLRRFRDPKTGKYLFLKDQNGEETTYTLTGNTTFDVSDKFQKDVVELLKIHPIYSRHLKFTDYRERAQAKVDSAKDKAKAFAIVEELSAVSRRSFARALGLPVDGRTDVEVQYQLLELADKNEDVNLGNAGKSGFSRIIELHNDPNAPAMMLLHDGNRAGVFKVRNKSWHYNDMPIGNSFEQALDYLLENEDLATNIKKEVAKKMKEIGL